MSCNWWQEGPPFPVRWTPLKCAVAAAVVAQGLPETVNIQPFVQSEELRVRTGCNRQCLAH